MNNCILCNKIFKSGRALARHIYSTHNITSKEYYDTYLKKSNEGICKTCGKPSIYHGLSRGYSEYCCRKCTDSNSDKQNKTKQTFIKKYGVDSIFKINDVHKKGVKLAQSKNAKLKRNNTNLKRYGNVNPFGSTEIIRKITNTKSANGTRSSLESIFESALILHNINYVTDYIDDRYPFHCDFYLVDTDTFIEINNYWMHNNHIFDKTNINDLNTLNNWKDKSKTSIQYKRAVEVWQQDALKYKYAIDNNLNYIIFWTKEDINTFIQNL